MGVELCDKVIEFAKRFMFPKADFEADFKSGKINKNNFVRREYLIREAKISDMNFLLKIEQDCWKEDLRADIDELTKRITHNACMNFVLEYQEKVVGVLYTQRIHQEDITKVKADTLEKFRVSDGKCVQLITLNIQKDYQDRGWGFELLEFALEYFSLSSTINKVYAVTRCRDFLKSNKETLQDYIKSICVSGKLKDPTLQFHQSHGAKVLGLLNKYRPRDLENQGYGVLIEYDIKKRRWIGNLPKVDTNKNKYSDQLLLNFLEKSLGINILDQDKSLYELGIDSLDFTELLLYMQQKLGVEISYKQLNSKTLKEILEYCNMKKDRNDASNLSLKKRIRYIMEKYEEVVPLALDGEGPLTFWIHPLSGDVSVYNNVANISDQAFRMIAIKACGFLSKTKKPLKSVIEMARYYCEIITSIQPQDPYRIVGFSFGGTIAYEIVRQLQLSGKKVESIVLIEAPYMDGRDRDLFETDIRNNLLMNANFLLLSLTNNTEYKNIIITEKEIIDIPTNDLTQHLAVLCKKRGLKHSVEELIFKITSMATVHISNLEAIRNYQVQPLIDKEVNAYLFRTKEANAISPELWNPDYLERIQKEKGSFLPLLKKWNKQFQKLETIVLSGNNHFDIFHEEKNIRHFYKHCVHIFSDRILNASFYEEKTKRPEKEIMPIAVIGMSGRFPDAVNVNELWDNLRDGRSSIKRFPKERGYNIDEYYDPQKKQPGKTYVRKGGFIDGVEQFDPMFFKISPNEALYIDPSERIFMEETWKAIEDAGYNPQKISGSLWGVFCCAKGDYSEKIVMDKDKAFYSPTNSFAGSRISYFLNLTGPSIFYDTACSSTLTAIEEACNSLVMGNCEVAIAGGGGICSTPSMMISSSQSLLFSPDEECYAFDERANGTVLGEAIGVVILKPLDKAIADKNHIYGIICGWGINQDGKTNGITAPSMIAQTNLQKQVYDKFNISPEDITMVEAHGTGTKLGDAIEFEALNNTFSSYTNKKSFCSLGTVKPNMGHAFFGAGILSVIKVLLSIKHHQIPPMINYDKNSCKINLDNSAFYITNKLLDWKRKDGKPLCCAINSFGATGTNVHLVIREYIDDLNRTNKFSNNENAVFFLSADSVEVLHDYVKEYLDAIDKNHLDNTDIYDISYTTKYARNDMKFRLGIIFHSLKDLRKKLEKFENGQYAEQIYFNKTDNLNSFARTYEEDNKILHKDKSNYLEECIKFWVKGIEIDWAFLYKDKEPRFISLPTYPFSKQVYWLNASKKEENVFAKDINVFAEQWKEKRIETGKTLQNETIICFVFKEKHRCLLKEKITFNNNINVVFISKQEENLDTDPGHYVMQDSTLNSFKEVLSRIQTDYSNVTKIVYFWPYEDNELIYKYENIINIIKAIDSVKIQIEEVILVGKYQTQIERCYLESWIGFERSLGKMIFRARVRSVLFEHSHSNSRDFHFDNLVCEIKATENYKSSLYCNNKRYELQIEPQEIITDEEVIKRNGTYLITGGMGKLGYLYAAHLAEKYSANLILTGRGKLDVERERKLRSLEENGGRALYFQADVCDKQKMEQVIEKGISEFGSLNGVLYMAGIANEASILKKSTVDFYQTIAPKIEGIQILNDVLNKFTIDFVCYFSSLAAILGDFGMCDYSIGNRFMMAYASYMNQLYNNGSVTRKTIVIGWPLWRDGGMKLKNGKDEEYLKASGQRFLETKEGIHCFEQILSKPTKQYFIITGDKKTIFNKFNIERQESEGTFPNMKNRTEELSTIQRDKLNGTVTVALKEIINQMQGIAIENIDENAYLTDYGFDSISLFDLARKVSEYLSIEISASSILGYPTIADLAEYITKTYKDELEKRNLTNLKHIDNTFDENEHEKHGTIEVCNDDVETQTCNEPIAIIGISGRFPQADNVEELWDKMYTAKDCITDIPKERWEIEDLSNLKKVSCKRGGFINGIDEFDPLFFNISPKEAKLIDPCQRIFLEEAWHALEDAGYMGRRIKGKCCGVFVGAEESQYASLVRKSGEVSIDQNALLSGRIAYFLNLKGPNMSITASCSSGLVALHQACQAIKNGECDMAIAGGACVISSPIFYEGMNELEILSEDGESYVFDARANGLVPAETVAVVVLKKLSQAIADQDHIYGLITGSGTNYNGRGSGIMTPNPRREAELLENILKKANTNPKDVQHIMTHSTGTPIGDAAEIEGLKSVFAKCKGKSHYLGNIKPFIGHTFAASGIVSLICMILELKYNTILGIKNLQNINKNIMVDETQFVFPKKNIEWSRSNSKPRVGVISTVSNSGVNAAAVIEEYIPHKEKRYVMQGKDDRMIFVFQATDTKQLFEVIKINYKFIKKNESLQLLDIAYSLQLGKEEMPERVAFIASNKDELLNNMEKYIKCSQEGIVLQDNTSIYMGRAVNRSKMITAVHKYEEKILEEIIKNKDLEMLCIFWTRGNYVDWSKLYDSEMKNFVSLPGYPFRKDKYWYFENKSKHSDHRKSSTENSMKEYVLEIFSKLIGVEYKDIETDKSIMDYGVDSITILKFVREFKKRYKYPLKSREIMAHITIDSLSDYLDTVVKTI